MDLLEMSWNSTLNSFQNLCIRKPKNEPQQTQITFCIFSSVYTQDLWRFASSSNSVFRFCLQLEYCASHRNGHETTCRTERTAWAHSKHPLNLNYRRWHWGIKVECRATENWFRHSSVFAFPHLIFCLTHFHKHRTAFLKKKKKKLYSPFDLCVRFSSYI